MYVGATDRGQSHWREQPHALKHGKSTKASHLDDVMQRREQADDVRTAIARLEARAKEMLAPSDTRVVRTLKSVHEVSKLSCGDATGSVHGHQRSDASTEMFMANLGFNVREQQRLLNQILSSRAAMQPADLHVAAEDELVTTDLESYLARCRNEAMQHAINSVHTVMAAREKEAVEKMLSETWARRKAGTMISAAQLPTPLAAAGGAAGAPGAHSSQHHSRAVGGDWEISSALQLEDFADVVQSAPPDEWLERFVAVVEEDSDVSPTALRLWGLVKELFGSVRPHASGSPTAKTAAAAHPSAQYLAASRRALEKTFFTQVIHATVEHEETQLPRLIAMHAKKAVEILYEYCTAEGTTPSPWVLVFYAMRSGRYDAAHLIAVDHGLPDCVCEGLETIHSAPLVDRNELGSLLNIDKALAHHDTNVDPFRCAVLVLLASGTPAAGATISNKIDVLNTVASSTEDTLWLRLALVRNPHLDDPSQPQITRLADLQRDLLGDQQYFLELVKGDLIALAELLFYAMLPSSALRILLDDAHLFLDAVHMVLVLDHCRVLAAAHTDQAVDVGRTLRRYAVGLVGYQKRGELRHPAGAIFAYFSKTHNLGAFGSLCSDEAMCVKLFGRGDNDSGVREGLLLEVPPTVELLDAMDQIAHKAATSDNIRLAVHVLLVLESLASSAKDHHRASHAITMALEFVNMALSQSAHYSQAATRAELIGISRKISQRIASVRHQVPPVELETFNHLSMIVEFLDVAAQGDADKALRLFYRLPFVPQQVAQVEAMAEEFNSMVSDAVVSAVQHAIVPAMRLLVVRFQAESNAAERTSVQQNAVALSRWVSRWKHQAGSQLQSQMIELEHQLSLR